MQFLLGIHAFIALLILLVGFVLIVKFAIGTARQSPFGRLDRMLAAIYTGLLDLQALLGIVLFLLRLDDGLASPVALHAAVALAGVVVAHLNARWRNQPDAVRFRNGLLTLGGSYILILAGVYFVNSFA
ncbi:MAG: hypothetical protein ACOYYF_17345 [Chloroflexota bacterium]|nr:hypothetical protein [Anaerolineae bacterium]MCB0102313.1 hypothetical protein [Anaerolineales bacterium]